MGRDRDEGGALYDHRIWLDRPEGGSNSGAQRSVAPEIRLERSRHGRMARPQRPRYCPGPSGFCGHRERASHVGRCARCTRLPATYGGHAVLCTGLFAAGALSGALKARFTCPHCLRLQASQAGSSSRRGPRSHGFKAVQSLCAERALHPSTAQAMRHDVALDPPHGRAKLGKCVYVPGAPQQPMLDKRAPGCSPIPAHVRNALGDLTVGVGT